LAQDQQSQPLSQAVLTEQKEPETETATERSEEDKKNGVILTQVIESLDAEKQSTLKENCDKVS